MGQTFINLTCEQLCDLMCGKPEDDYEEMEEKRMGRGSSKMNGSGTAATGPAVEVELTEEQMVAEMEQEFEKINKTLDEFLNNNPKNRPLDTFDENLPYIEKSTIKALKWSYIDEYNKSVENYGDGFEFYDPDQTITILYKDGSALFVSPDWTDGSKKIPTSNIDTIIVDSGWGSAVAGKHVKLENYRETVGYGKYAYKDVKQRYDDFNDIRTGFSIEPTRWRKM